MEENKVIYFGQFDKSTDDFINWLNKSKPGEKYCYFLGTRVVGKKVGRIAFEAYENGLVTLFQKRTGEKMAYWAQKKAVYQ